MKTKHFLIILFIITAFGFLLRFWQYPERFGLAYDQAHDVIVAREAIREGKIPLLGPFSSAGAFQTSGTWYWLIMMGVSIYPKSILTPWIFMTALCGLMIIGMGFLGRYIEDERFGLILALLTAISTAQIAQSVNLTNQTPIPILAMLTILFAIRYMREKRVVDAVSLGFFSALAVSIHLQGVTLAIPVLIAFLLAGKQKIYSFPLAVLAAFLPVSPVLIWDYSHQFINVHNMFYYYTKDQFTISLDVLGRRWLTYLDTFWPHEWAHIIGGLPQIAIGIALLAVGIFLFLGVQKKIRKEWLFIFFSIGGMVILVRYTHAPLFSSFITFIHPFVLLISAWTIYQIFLRNKYIGILVLAIVFGASAWKTYPEVFPIKVNLTAKASKETRQLLTQKFPGEQFFVYDLNYDETQRSVPEVLYLDEANLLSDTGRRIGYIRAKAQLLLNTDIITSSSGLIADLSSSDSATLMNDKWAPLTPSQIYVSTEEWR